MRKEFNPQRIFLVHQHGSRFIVLEHQYGRRDVMWKSSITNRAVALAWENSRNFAMLPLVSPRNDVWETSANIPYCWWRITTQIWAVLLIGWSKFPTRHNQSKTLPRSLWWHVISMEFLRSFLRRHFGCFLRLGGLGWVCATGMYRSTYWPFLWLGRLACVQQQQLNFI